MAEIYSVNELFPIKISCSEMLSSVDYWPMTYLVEEEEPCQQWEEQQHDKF